MSNEKIYTIRISEAMEKKCGCPLCTVESDLQNDEVERILGASMMEPNVRVQTNAHHAGLALGEPCKFQPCFFHTLALPLDHENLIFAAVFE